MSNKERIKLEIDVLKALLLAFLTAIFGVFGYSVINYQKIDILQGISIIAGLFILFLIVYFIAKRTIRNLNKIEELE
ncbi:putative membrane protein [Campylobacter hyointestinalis subsp. lawsonii CCUG 27631]|uniref:hypothetical protein n=1 Tax=Campylobacter hyointestinalis TaxID=198 RepID=UPI0007C8FD33|nr:hypothetical protein [Campylobacter hyointestinalis]ANE34139.1 putative membrane protein [Campylobacter hyointestinalis subsp. lawsonii CCUG 27631]